MIKKYLKNLGGKKANFFFQGTVGQGVEISVFELLVFPNPLGSCDWVFTNYNNLSSNLSTINYEFINMVLTGFSKMLIFMK